MRNISTSTQQLLADVDSDVLVVEPDPAERTTAF